jgi:hypothetical protein
MCGEGKAGAGDFGEPGVIAIGGDFGQLLDATASNRGDNAHSDHELASAPSFLI